MSHPLLVVCEAPDDFALASRLIDRTIAECGPEWVRDDLVAARNYFGIHPVPTPHDPPFILWGNLTAVIEHLTTGANGKVRRVQLNFAQFGGGFPDHTEAKRFLEFIRAVQTYEQPISVDGFLLLRDADSHSKDRTELRKLNALGRFKQFPVVVGVPDPESECWALAGFPHGATDREQETITEIQREADGVHPCRQSHRLRASDTGDIRHPKQILARLTGRDPDRLARCLDAPSDLLRQHGRENGLADFMDALRDRLIPGLFGGADA